ncbi:uncharacterized protein LTR77_002647 [Saxophila tyrrhenica]|uniref:DUF7730 domain-containing protein n=1 Tax=Saxophila tyrrhenica TaxID=1690608 RepID=A0AAV9PFM2_9PEZI|nr:hypothetical protein LTR77_002647 [Saxophila tyrrhenica]
MPNLSKCYLLQTIPPELRLLIYQHVFNFHNSTFAVPIFLLWRGNIATDSRAWAHAALTKTCRKIYNEASPVLYDHHTFRIFTSTDHEDEIIDTCGDLGRSLRDVTWLSRIRHLEIGLQGSISRLPETERLQHERLALGLIETLAEAVAASGAKVRTLGIQQEFEYSPERNVRRLRERVESWGGVVRVGVRVFWPDEEMD